MKKVLLIALFAIFTIAAVSVAAETPATIDLQKEWATNPTKNPVKFDHAFHQTKNKCVDCHATEAGGKIKLEGEIKGLNDKNPAHKFCWTCHTTNNVKVGKTCTKCHIK